MKTLSLIACTVLISALAPAQAETHGLRMTIFPNSGLPGESILAEFELDRDFPLGATVQFALDGQPIGAEQAMLDGAARMSIPSMGHGNHTVSAQYVTTGGAEAGVVEARVLANTPPVLPHFGLNVTAGKSASFSASALLKCIQDNDGDRVSIQHIDTTSQAGAKVTMRGDLVTYIPASGVTGRDSIRYQAVDAYGATVTGAVEVRVRTEDARPKITIAGGKLILTAPLGMSLAVQTSNDSKEWTTLQSFDGTTRTAQVANWNCADYPNNFYRTIPVPSEVPEQNSVVLAASLKTQ